MEEIKKRYSNFELLKVISIIMVLILHYFNGNMGGALRHVPIYSYNYYVMHFLESMSIIAVNCFVLVSGYFMIGKNQVKLIKALNLATIAIFYGGVFYLFTSLLGINGLTFSIKEFLLALVPFYGAKWFVASYIVLFALSPFLNKLLTQLTKRQFQQFLIVLIVTLSIMPTLLRDLSYNDNGYGVLSFVLLYCIAAYFKLHYSNSLSKWFYLGLYLLSVTVTFGLAITGFQNYDYNSFFNLLSAVSIFLFFSKLNIEFKAINYLATFTFPIYLIHTEPPLREIIFRDILRTNLFWNSNWFFLHLVISVTIIFFGCVLIELSRKLFLNLFWKREKLKYLKKVSIG
ncbi:acyltransferase [Mesobacillus maritimus]|uniref:Acyltransferase family protein n=1 Tax=Mesobacillus maritimus TaxID=1643336 RepID=A0ABS7K4Q7_9BACI|nr:acyltransferase family protein [Mesobacillus maritimus]MBY0097110.1 acyltransferase family protein [Mesobacillus maritimus]